MTEVAARASRVTPRSVSPLRFALACPILVACAHSTSPGGPVDAARGADAAPADAPAGDAPASDSLPAPYRHTIVLDGMDDFAAADTFTTTSSPSYTARVTWDDHDLYIGYSGPDLSPQTTDASTKWLFVYLDTDPGAGTGATQSQVYTTQGATFPPGFGAEYYVRYKVDGTLTSLEQDQNGTWTTVTPAPSTAQAGTYVELAIPLAQIGAGAKLGVVTWMINEKQLAEGSYAGLYQGNFTDGYAASLAITKYLLADFTSSRDPDDPANQAP